MSGFIRSNIPKKTVDFNDSEDSEDEYLHAKRRKRSGSEPKPEEKQSKPFKRSKTYKADTITDLKVVTVEDCSLLSYETISSQSVLFSCISEIHETAATISLPGAMHAIAPKSLITQYSHLSLRNILNERQIVTCKVISKRRSVDNSWKVIVTLDPSKVNSHIPHYAVHIGMSLMGVVQSKEDHGFIVDCGIVNLRAFLSSKAAGNWCRTFNEGKSLEAGQLIRCLVAKINSNSNASNVELTTDIDVPNLVSNVDVNAVNVMPGSLFSVSFKTVLSNGIKVSVRGLRSASGYINDLHRETKSKKKYKPGVPFYACVLYSSNSYSKVFLGSREYFLQLRLEAPLLSCKTAINNAKVLSIKKEGVFIKFLMNDQSQKGFLTLGNAEKLVSDEAEEKVVATGSTGNTDSDYGSEPGETFENLSSCEKPRSKQNIFNRLQRKLKQEKLITCHVSHYSYMDQMYYCYVKSEFEDDSVDLSSFQLKDCPNWLQIGKEFAVTVTQVTSKFLCVRVKEINGVIPVDQVSDNIELAPLILKSYEEDDIIESTCFCSLDNGIPVFSVKFSIRKFFKKNRKNLPHGWSSVTEGMVVPFSVLENVNGRISGIIVSTNVIHFPEVMVTDEDLLLPKLPVLRPACQQTVLGLVTKHDETELALNCQLHKVWKSDLNESVEYLWNLLSEVSRIQRLSTGSQVQSFVRSKNDDGSWKLNFLVYKEILGHLSPQSDESNMSVGNPLSVTVLWDDVLERTVHVTLEKKLLSGEGDDTSSLKVGTSIKCKILFKHKDFNIGCITSGVSDSEGRIVHIITKLHLNDFQRILSQIDTALETVVDVHILKIMNGIVIGINCEALEIIKTIASEDFDLENNKCKNINDKKPIKEQKTKKTVDSVTSSKKRDLLMMLNDLDKEYSSGEEAIEEKVKTDKEKSKNKKQKNNLDKSRPDKKKKTLNTSSKDNVEASVNDNEIVDSIFTKGVKSRKSVETKLSDSGFDWNASLTSVQETVATDQKSDDSDEEQIKQTSAKKKKKLTPAERREVMKQKEAKIKQAEEELLNADKNPQSADHFDRLLLASPNSSAIWVKYMAYHLQGTEIEKARSVAKRALQAINHREEEERMNVWVALLNLENLYGTSDSVQKCMNEAVQTNDEWQIYSRVMQIFVNSNKTKELERLADLATRKLKNSFNVYVQCGEYLLQAGSVEKSRSIMQRGLTVLPKKLHVDLTVRFAHFENRHGCPERAQTLFEHILTSFPKRVDIWISYVDLLIKGNRIDLARQVVERAVALRLKPHKMKSLYKKWLDFEKKYGTPESVSGVKDEIKKYMDFKVPV